MLCCVSVHNFGIGSDSPAWLWSTNVVGIRACCVCSQIMFSIRKCVLFVCCRSHPYWNEKKINCTYILLLPSAPHLHKIVVVVVVAHLIPMWNKNTSVESHTKSADSILASEREQSYVVNIGINYIHFESGCDNILHIWILVTYNNKTVNHVSAQKRYTIYT